MTSGSGADALDRDLCFVGTARSARPAAPRFTFALDFGSARAWPDLPYDAAAPAAWLDDARRAQVQAILDTAASVMAERAPAAFAFVEAELDEALLRQNDAVAGASSASNRDCIGACLLTNLHRTPDAVHIAVEGLLHEAIHQRLYRLEAAGGSFCDLGEAPTFRSPWSGARLPLHSLVHACFVWYGLLTMWAGVADARGPAGEQRHARERAQHCLFGFAFLADLIDGPGFPRTQIESMALQRIRGFAQQALDAMQAADGDSPLSALREARESAGWSARLAAGLAGPSAT